MVELFYFDKEMFNQLPSVERIRYLDLIKKNVVPSGRPFFLDDAGLPDRELEGFCNYLLNPHRGSAKTWATYAIQVAVFERFMRAQGLAWKAATKKHLDLYYTVRITGEFQNRPPLKSRSWNVVKAAIVHLFEYALDEGIIAELPFKYRKSKSPFGGKGAETADFGAKFTPEPINFISLTNYKNLWCPLIANGENSQRNKALIDTLIVSGLRISEMLNLEVHQIPDPDDQRFAGRKGVTIRVVGKGAKARKVLVPKRFVRAIRFYIEEEREEILRRSRKTKCNQSVKEPTKVFLCRTGQPLSSRAVQTYFKNISKKTGVNLTPHGCRHTFAIYQLEAMIKRMAINLKKLREGGADAYRQILNDPLRDLQRLLGHSDISSTYIYLDFLEESEALVDESLEDWTNWGNENGR